MRKTTTREFLWRICWVLSLLTMNACSSPGQPLATVEQVDLDRFMGSWYVIANIPTFLEKEAYNAVETYRQAADGSIETTFTFRKGGFDGEAKEYTPRGFVGDDPSNAVWGMQFIWPIKADYRIIYLASDYSVTVIGRNKRDFVWIMARAPAIDDNLYQRLIAFIEASGYDVDKIRKVPQRW